MGYLTRVEGRISIHPPLIVKELREHPEITDPNGSVIVRVNKVSEPTDYGRAVTLTGVFIECVTEEGFKAYNLEDEVMHIAELFPDRTFIGFLECDGEEKSDLWRLVGHGNTIDRVEPLLLWPEGSE